MIRLRLEELAKRRGMSQSLLQRTSGVTLTMLRRYWINDTDSWHRESLEKLARALNVRVIDLIEEWPEERKQEDLETYRETSTEEDTFFVDHIEQDTVPVIQEIGGTVQYDSEVRRMDGHVGRTRVTLPAGCTYSGYAAGRDNPQIIELPGGRKLVLSRRGSYEMALGFQGGDSSDPSRWNGAQRIPDEEEVNQ